MALAESAKGEQRGRGAGRVRSKAIRGHGARQQRKGKMSGPDSMRWHDRAAPADLPDFAAPQFTLHMSELTHFDAQGQAHMVDVSAKADTLRVAVAEGRIRMAASTLALVAEGRAGKGDVLGVARIAAIQGAKRTSDLIPLCHPLPLTKVAVSFTLEDAPPAVRCEVSAQTVGPTGVEMEALTAVQVGLLTVYDMLKAADRGMLITDVGLLRKEGGRSGTWVRGGDVPTAA